MVNNVLCRINPGVHEKDSAMSAVEFAVKLHPVVTICADAYDWPCPTIAATGCFDAGESRRARRVDPVNLIEVFEEW